MSSNKHTVIPADGQPDEAVNLAYDFFNRIDHTWEATTLDSIGHSLEREMTKLDRAQEGIGFNLWLWLGLKEDGETKMANEFRQTLISDLRQLRHKAGPPH